MGPLSIVFAVGEVSSMSLSTGLGILGASLGAGLVLVGAATGIGRLAAAALEGTARQPEATGDLRVSMIIPAALIEGIALFALVICLLASLHIPTHSENEKEAVWGVDGAIKHAEWEKEFEEKNKE